MADTPSTPRERHAAVSAQLGDDYTPQFDAFLAAEENADDTAHHEGFARRSDAWYEIWSATYTQQLEELPAEEPAEEAAGLSELFNDHDPIPEWAKASVPGPAPSQLGESGAMMLRTHHAKLTREQEAHIDLLMEAGHFPTEARPAWRRLIHAMPAEKVTAFIDALPPF